MTEFEHYTGSVKYRITLELTDREHAMLVELLEQQEERATMPELGIATAEGCVGLAREILGDVTGPMEDLIDETDAGELRDTLVAWFKRLEDLDEELRDAFNMEPPLLNVDPALLVMVRDEWHYAKERVA
jgi:hypothetical protein